MSDINFELFKKQQEWDALDEAAFDEDKVRAEE